MEMPLQVIAELENKGMFLPGMDNRASWLTHVYSEAFSQPP